MSLSPALQRLVDAELAAMPVLLEQVCRQTVIALRHPADAALSPAERMLRLALLILVIVSLLFAVYSWI